MIERSILNSGVWEIAETNAVKKYIKENDIVFDIGANVGYYSLLMSKIVGSDGEVHCFEPTSYAFEKLQKNITLNPQINTSNLILNQKGLASKSSKAIEAIESRFSQKIIAYNSPEEISFITLDDYAKNLNKINFIKIDVDGYDYEVISGGMFLLSKLKPIVMAEVNSQALSLKEKTVDDYLKLYTECGYQFCEILGKETINMSLNDFLKNWKTDYNPCDLNMIIYS